MDNEREKRNSEYIFAAVYGENEGEVWETDLQKVRNQFIESLERWQPENGTNTPFENGKIDLSKLFDSELQGNHNLESNVLSNVTDHLTDVFYVYDTIMVLHLIREWEKQEDKSKAPLLSNEYMIAVHKIIQIKWFAYLATLFFCNKNFKKKSENLFFYHLRFYLIFLILIEFPFTQIFPDMDLTRPDGDFPSSFWYFDIDIIFSGIFGEYFIRIYNRINQNWDVFIKSIHKILDYINDWKKDLIVRLLSFKEEALAESKELLKNNKFDNAIIHCFETVALLNYEDPQNDIYMIDLWTKIKTDLESSGQKIVKKYADRKCVAITGDFAKTSKENKKIMYSISDIDDCNKCGNGPYDDKCNRHEECTAFKDVCEIIENKIYAILNLKDWNIIRCSLKDNDVQYVTSEKEDISYSKFYNEFNKEGNEELICSKCSLKNNTCKKKESGMGQCRLMFSCAERKLFIAIGNEREFVFTSRPNCELCLSVHKKHYSEIKLIYPGKPSAKLSDFDPLANIFLDRINK